jgi:hypothetical protein
VHPLITSRGSITLPRLLDILRPYLSRTMACKYTVNRVYKVQSGVECEEGVKNKVGLIVWREDDVVM